MGRGGEGWGRVGGGGQGMADGKETRCGSHS